MHTGRLFDIKKLLVIFLLLSLSQLPARSNSKEHHFLFFILRVDKYDKDKWRHILLSFFRATMYVWIVIWLLLASTSGQRHRISPFTGERIALPSEFRYKVTRSRKDWPDLSAPQQLDWQAQELGVLIHFNMATYLDNHDGCSGQIVPPISHFNPYKLSTDNWIQTAVDFGARYAVLVTKHACGFLLSPTNVTFPLSPSGEMVPYNYTVAYSPVKGANIVDEFIKSCNKQNVRTGFYYTVQDNDYLNVHHGYVS